VLFNPAITGTAQMYSFLTHKEFSKVQINDRLKIMSINKKKEQNHLES